MDPELGPVLVVGSGRVGSALVRALHGAGVSVDGLISRDPERARRAIDDDVPALHFDSPLPDDARLLVLAVPDDVLEDVAERLSQSATAAPGACAMHTSGLHTSEALAPFAMKGFDVVSFHPVASFPPPGRDEEVFPHITVTLEGSDRGTRVGTAVARRLQSIPLPVTREQKQVIHLAAVYAANYAVTLFGGASDMLTNVGLQEDDANRLLHPLLASVIANLQGSTPGDALTGPIARGDVEVVRRHLELIDRVQPELGPVYRQLGRATAAMAARAGRLSPDLCDEVSELLR